MKQIAVLILTVLSIFLIPHTAIAVSFTPGSVDATPTAIDTPILGNGIAGVSLEYLESATDFRFLLYGNSVDPGASLAFDWEGVYWKGSVLVSQQDGSNMGKALVITGTVTHRVLNPVGPLLEYEVVAGGSNGTVDEELGPLFPIIEEAHDGANDKLTGNLRVSEGRTFLNLALPANQVGWLWDLKGFHGAGGGSQQDGGPIITNIRAIPLPAALPLYGAGLLLLGLLSHLRKRRSPV